MNCQVPSDGFPRGSYSKMIYPLTTAVFAEEPAKWLAEQNAMQTAILDNPNILPQDVEVERLIEYYKAADQMERSAIRSSVQELDTMERSRFRSSFQQIGTSLLLFSHRFAIMALRKNDNECLRKSLLALSIEDVTNDPRETISYLIICNYVCDKHGGDFRVECQQLEVFSSSKFRQFLRDFWARPSGFNSLAATGMKEMRTPNGPLIC